MLLIDVISQQSIMLITSYCLFEWALTGTVNAISDFNQY